MKPTEEEMTALAAELLEIDLRLPSVCELIYDCDESYITLFMTLDKQYALDFIERVKLHDASFIKWHGIDENADEAIIERYEDTHPLAPYSRKIFHGMYEDSFSEWSLKYVGESLATGLSVIEHELIKGERCE